MILSSAFQEAFPNAPHTISCSIPHLPTGDSQYSALALSSAMSRNVYVYICCLPPGHAHCLSHLLSPVLRTTPGME